MVRNEFTFPSADGKTAIHAAEWLPETVAETALTLMALAYLVAGLCVMFAVFALRRLFREDQTPQPAA